MRSGADTVLALVAAVLALTVIAGAVPRWRRHLPKVAGLGAGGILAVFLVGRGVAEFFVVHYGDPASYRNDWGGPSLAGVFAVHSGPGAAILIGTGAYLIRRWRQGRRARGLGAGASAGASASASTGARAFSLAKRDA